MEQLTKEEWMLVRAMCTFCFTRLPATSKYKKLVDGIWTKAVHETAPPRLADADAILEDRKVFMDMLAALHDFHPN